jgi:hypothetical protein
MLLHEILEQLLAFERHYGDALEVGAVEAILGRDVDLAQLERDVGADAFQRLPRVDAQVTVGLGIES